MNDQSVELHRKYRPTKFSEVVGQEEAVATLQDFGRRGCMPHCLLFSGPSGVGKTTLARILRVKLKCSDVDFQEMNLANLRGIDEARRIEQRMRLAPMGGETRVWLLDEVHKLTGDAQNSLLKPLEEPPRHVYFMLCTTDPQRLIATVRNRCTEIKLGLVDDVRMAKLLADVAGREGIELAEEVSDRIVKVAEGSPRRGLVLLGQCMGRETVEEQVKAVGIADSAQQAIEIARLLMRPRGSGWSELAKVLRDVEGEDVEGLRYLVLAYCRKVLLGGGKMAPRAFEVVQIFRDNFWDSKHAGLAAACWEANGTTGV